MSKDSNRSCLAAGGHAQFADYYYVERRLQRFRDFSSNRKTAPGQSQDDRVSCVGVITAEEITSKERE